MYRTVSAIGLLMVFTGIVTAQQTIFIEAYKGQMLATHSATLPGTRPTTYVTGFEAENSRVVLMARAPKAGVYEMSIRYRAPSGPKGFEVAVNGLTISGMFPRTNSDFADCAAGRVELVQGANEIAVKRGWGYFDIEGIGFSPLEIKPPAKPPKKLSDPAATVQAKALFSYLIDQYGRGMLSGGYNADERDYVKQKTGQTPTILGGDFMDYSPSRVAHGTKPQSVEELIRQVQSNKQILTMCWHWNAPTDLIDKMDKDAQGKEVDHLWYRGFYTEATTFDVQAALADETSPKYQLLLSDIDAIAVQIKKLSDANIPVLWRPLHEAEGGWFWWGAKGPDAFKKLWRLLYDRLTVHHQLHNLIWVYTSGGDPAWYPGNDCVDVVGIDAYPSDVRDPSGQLWDSLTKQFGGQKLLAISEFGGVPDVARMQRLGCYWSYFVSWTGDVGPKKMTLPDLQRIYDGPGTINLSLYLKSSVQSR